MTARSKSKSVKDHIAQHGDGLPWDGSSPEDRETFVAAYRTMVLIRCFERETQRQFERGQVHGTTHLCIGQEAVPVGVCLALAADDYVVGTYRGHGLALAKGSDPTALFAEMMGRSTGTCGGRAGSMNVIDRDVGLIGCYGIVGASMAAGIGLGLSGRVSGSTTAAFFGDGAVNQAYFAECVNFAVVFELPVVFVCENNLYGEFTPMEEVTAGADLAARAEVFGLPTEKVDGNDVRAVRAAAQRAVERAREGRGPTFLECLTYRHLGHSRSDPATYRPAGELEQWLERDPLTTARSHLTGALDFSTEEIDRIDNEIAQLVQEYVKEAIEQPYPEAPPTWT